jgi:hypothetical protein
MSSIAPRYACKLQFLAMSQLLTFLRIADGFGFREKMMAWNQEQIPVSIAKQIGWNMAIDAVGAGVYGGIVKRDWSGSIVIGDEWPENNVAPPAHNPLHPTGPYLDFSKYNSANRGYAKIASLISKGAVSELEGLFQSIPDDASRRKLANLVMTGGARPLHMCGMGSGADTSEIITVLIKYGADVNAKDNYELTPKDRMAGNIALQRHRGVSGRDLPLGVPMWTSDDFMYTGPGESEVQKAAEDVGASAESESNPLPWVVGGAALLLLVQLYYRELA